MFAITLVFIVTEGVNYSVNPSSCRMVNSRIVLPWNGILCC